MLKGNYHETLKVFRMNTGHWVTSGKELVSVNGGKRKVSNFRRKMQLSNRGLQKFLEGLAANARERLLFKTQEMGKWSQKELLYKLHPLLTVTIQTFRGIHVSKGL